MCQRLALIGEQQHDVAGSCLGLRNAKRSPTRWIASAICRPFSVCRGRRKRKPFFAQHLRELRTRDGYTFAPLDLLGQSRQRPIRPVRHRPSQERTSDLERGLRLHRQWAARHLRPHGFDAARLEIGTPQPYRILAHAERLRNPCSRPA
jgi:hypothetical protein